MDESETSADAVNTKAHAIVQEECIKPLKGAAGKEVPNMVISSESGERALYSSIQKHLCCSSQRIRVYDFESGEAYTGSRQ
jgi:hypothetical protein